MPDPLADLYKSIQVSSKADLKSPIVGEKLAHMCALSLGFIKERADFVELRSDVPPKRYVMAQLKTGTKTSRPINRDLFETDVTSIQIESVLTGEPSTLDESDLSKILYTMALAYCVARDLVAKDDKKSPATFFESLVGHIVASRFGVNPTKQVTIPTEGIENNTLPTDFIFDLGWGRNKIHMPVKISTRERVIQAWAHQRVLDGMLGAGRYQGVLVALTETNKKLEVAVAEVCLPGQWAAYQMYLAPMRRIYYFDIPKKYVRLRDIYPFVPVWPFAKFFTEIPQITTPQPQG